MILAEAVEALARALGVWLPAGVPRWSIQTWEAGYIVTDWMQPSPCLQWPLTDSEAMLWLRCYLLGTTRVRCPDCEGGARWRCVWTNYLDDTGKAEAERDGRAELLGVPHRIVRGTDESGRSVVDVQRADPCPICTGPAVECETCHGIGETPPSGLACRPCKGKGYFPGEPTGHVDRSWAEVFVRSMPRWREVGDGEVKWCDQCFRDGDEVRAPWLELAEPERGACSREHMPPGALGDPDARERLTRLADQLQLQALDGLGGDSPEQAPELGVWLALYLGQHPCEDVGRRSYAIEGIDHLVDCSRCAGSGLALGAHADAMAEAGLRLAQGLEHAEAAE